MLLQIRSLLLFLLIGIFSVLRAQEKKDSIAKSINKNEPKKFDDFIKSTAFADSGLFNIYLQEDRYYAEISKEILNKDLLLVSRISKGGANTNSYAGDEISSMVIQFDRGPGYKLFIRQISFSTYSGDSASQLHQAVQNSNLQPIVAAFEIKAFSKNDGGYIIDLTDYLNSDNNIFFLDQATKENLHLSSYQPDKSYVNKISSYPLNIEIKTIKTYSKPPATGGIPGTSRPMAMGAAATLELNTSLVLLPEKLMQSRAHDSRIGYFSVSYDDYGANPNGIKKINLIKRWRLEPKEEDVEKYMKGELVEPQKPIIFYIDPATPKKWVPYLIQSVRDWQQAFEQAGFKNAIYAREAPGKEEDSTWSLDDARHSVIVYKASPTENASGPSIADPRTGEILESHINWHHSITQLLQRWYFIQASPSDLRARKMILDDSLMGRLIRFASSHEVGHTLGLLHNMGASSTVPVDSLRNKVWVEKNGHTPSIMDYARFNYVAQPEDHISPSGIYPRIGDYDKWAIEWGYRLFPQYKNTNEENAYLNKWVIAKLANKRLRFGAENSFDPRNQAEDLGNDAMKAGMYGIKNLKYILLHLLEWTRVPNEDYDNLTTMYREVVYQYQRYINHVSMNVVGEYTTPKYVEQPGAISEVVPKEIKKRAITFLNEQLFTTPTWLLNDSILNKCGGDPFGLISSIQMSTLANLLSPMMLNSFFEDESKYGSQVYTAQELFDDLRKGIWSELYNYKTISLYRRSLQKKHISSLLTLSGLSSATSSVSSASDASSFAVAELTRLYKDMKVAILHIQDSTSKYHLSELALKLSKVLSENK